MDDKRKPRPWSAKRAAVAMSNAPGWLDPQVAEQTIHERGGAEVITCNHGPKALCDVCRIDLQRYELDTMRANLAAMQARAEKAETDLAAARESVDHLSGLLTEERERAKALEATLRDLRAVMADQEPVVLAATQLVSDDSEYVRSVLGNAVRAMLAARAKRGAGEGGASAL